MRWPSRESVFSTPSSWNAEKATVFLGFNQLEVSSGKTLKKFSGYFEIVIARPRDAWQPKGQELQRIQRFEREAIPHLHSIQRAAARTVRDDLQAEDISQEVYVTAWRIFDRYEPGSNCKAWLFRILMYTIDRHRRKESRQANAKGSDFIDRIPAGLEQRATLSDPLLLSAMESLPGDFRDVLEIVDVEVFPYREAAETLGIAVGTVMSRLSRARDRMRVMIRPAAGPRGAISAGIFSV